MRRAGVIRTFMSWQDDSLIEEDGDIDDASRKVSIRDALPVSGLTR